MHQLAVAIHVGASAGPNRAAFLDDVVAVGQALQNVEVLVDDKNRLSTRLQEADAFPNLTANDRR